MSTLAVLAAAGVAATALGLALMLCVAAARADRRVRSALLDALGRSQQDEWALIQRQQTAGYKQHAAN